MVKPCPKGVPGCGWTAAAFKSRGRYRETIASHLDLLADLGMLGRVDTPEGPRWHRPQALGA